MPYLLHIETSTQSCSVSFSRGVEVINEKEIVRTDFSHAEYLPVFIEEILRESKNKIDAVAVSAGPGSYTGLRIGCSMAKGICFGRDIPLISLSTLDILYASAVDGSNRYVISTLNSRADEVYYSVFGRDGERITEDTFVSLSPDFFSEYKAEHSKPLVVGTGADKCRKILSEHEFDFQSTYPSARFMPQLANDKYQKGEFVDLRHFEPNYIKPFISTYKK